MPLILTKKLFTPSMHECTVNYCANNELQKKEIMPSLGSLPRTIMAFQDIRTTTLATCWLLKVEVKQRG